jgi:hypothetical protein
MYVLWQIHKKSQLPQPFAVDGNSEGREEQQKDGLYSTLQTFQRSNAVRYGKS